MVTSRPIVKFVRQVILRIYIICSSDHLTPTTNVLTFN